MQKSSTERALRTRLWSSASPALALACSLLVGCGDDSARVMPLELRINEVVSDNAGVWEDELGETDDYVELFNASAEPRNLADYRIEDKGGKHALPEFVLEPGAVVLLFADDAPEQGILHLPFKISASGEELRLLRASSEQTVDAIEVPALAEHRAFLRIPDGTGAFSDCGWATPARLNGELCGSPPPPELPDDVSFEEFEWPSPWPSLPEPLLISEAALQPAGFVEISNRSEESLSLADFTLLLAPHQVGEPWPDATSGVALSWPSETLEAGERVSVEVNEDDLAALAADPHFAGVLTLFRASDQSLVERVDFSDWPSGATLARFPDPDGPFRFCENDSEGEPNESCTELPSRDLGQHVERLLTPDDFRALAAGSQDLGVESVEFVIDLDAGGVVTFLDSAAWDLHYVFIRERIDGLAPLDRCVPEERTQFNQEWFAFSQEHYFSVEGRRYLLGTLVHHAGSGLKTVEFAVGDAISPEQMQQAFFTVMERVPDPKDWSIRPQTTGQLTRARTIEGQLPIVGPNAPFQGVSYQPLTRGVAYGTLRFVPAEELRTAALGPRDIVVTDQVPNDIPLLGGLITESFQTPLAHVNVLSRGRGTPNMALAAAREDPRLQAGFETLVRLEVSGSDFTLEPGDPEEALAFWESRRPSGPLLAPGLDVDTRGVQSLAERTFADIATVGGKAAQFAELARVPLCSGDVEVPDQAFAIPVVHSLEHYEWSGARALLDELRQDPEFLTDPKLRDAGLLRVRERVLDYPVEPSLVNDVALAIEARWPERRVRFRSSSNTEDLAGFNGAGLYVSDGIDGEDIPDGIEDAIRTVWAGLWERRAYDEREYYNVDQSQVAMGVLIHPAQPSERVNGVAVSRDALNPNHADRYYINVQRGEAQVTNPAPGITSDEFTYSLTRADPITFHARSTFSPDAPVMSSAEAGFLACNLRAIHQHFQPLLDPNSENPWFAVDIEFKLMGVDRTLLIKQARTYSFGSEVPTGWCDYY